MGGPHLFITFNPSQQAPTVDRRNSYIISIMLKDVRDWVRLKNYQYELTFGLYMLEGWEKATFSKGADSEDRHVPAANCGQFIDTVVLLLLTLILYSAYSQLPHYTSALVRKTVYYMSSDTL